MLVKSPGNHCTLRWNAGRVTGMTSSENVTVNGVPRHVPDLRRLFVDEGDKGADDVDTEGDEVEEDESEVEVNVEDELQPAELRPACQLRASGSMTKTLPDKDPTHTGKKTRTYQTKFTQ